MRYHVIVLQKLSFQKVDVLKYLLNIVTRNEAIDTHKVSTVCDLRYFHASPRGWQHILSLFAVVMESLLRNCRRVNSVDLACFVMLHYSESLLQKLLDLSVEFLNRIFIVVEMRVDHIELFIFYIEIFTTLLVIRNNRDVIALRFPIEPIHITLNKTLVQS